MRARGVKVGITGSLASGKTTALRFFRAAGYGTVSADRISHKLLKKGTPFYRGAVCHFGKDILLANGEISRKKLGGIVFENKKERKFLEKLLHPGIKRETAALVKRVKNIAVENSLLFEMRTENLFDFIICVTASGGKTAQNLRRRKIPLSLANRIMKAQGQSAEKAKKADFIVKNNSTLFNFQKKINKIIQTISFPR